VVKAIDELEEDLMVIATNMSYEIHMPEAQRQRFLRRAQENVKDLSAVFINPNECLCRVWQIRTKKTEEHKANARLIGDRLQRRRSMK
jgi:hypothetical protein